MIDILKNSDMRRFLGSLARGIEVRYRERGGPYERANLYEVQRARGSRVNLLIDLCWRLKSKQKKVSVVVNPFSDQPHPLLDVVSFDGSMWIALQDFARQPLGGILSGGYFSRELAGKRVKFHTFSRAGTISTEILKAKGVISSSDRQQVVCCMNAVSFVVFPY